MIDIDGSIPIGAERAESTVYRTVPVAPARVELACAPNLAMTIPDVKAFDTGVEPDIATALPLFCRVHKKGTDPRQLPP